jgi:hypothetical protein
MKYCVELIRDENQEITQRNILFAVMQICAIPRGKECIFVEGSDSDNISLKRCVLDENNEPIIENDPDKIAIQISENEIDLRMKRQDFGRRLIAIISIRNDSKDLDASEIVQFATDYATINTALLNGSIGTAKALIQAITPDGVITTQADKDALINEINAKETELGY